MSGQKGRIFVGLNKGCHDAAVCVLDTRDPEIRAEMWLKERWTRRKRAGGDVSVLLQRTMDLPLPPKAQVLVAESSFGCRPNAAESFLDKQFPYFKFIAGMGLDRFVSRFNSRLRFLPHHYCHAMSAAAISPFTRSLILVLDGGGSCSKAFGSTHPEIKRFPPPAGDADECHVTEALSLYAQEGAQLHCLRKDWQILENLPQRRDVLISHGLGKFYAAASSFIFNSKEQPGKVMGLAAFGRPNRISDRVLFYKNLDWAKACTGANPAEWQASPHFRLYADIAASVQKHFEDILLSLIADIKRRHPGYSNLVLTGGCALNCAANIRIVRSRLFQRLYIPPFPGDEGIAFGAAQCLRFRSGLPWRPTSRRIQTGNFGARLSVPMERDIRRVFAGFMIERLPDSTATAAELLSRRYVLGWFHGRSESGPRALGFRSLLASPMIPGLRDRLNRHVKGRESFRPYGCSTLWERAHRYFCVEKGLDSPFMSFAPEVRMRYRPALRAVTHADGTSRIQTVRRTQNPQFHRLIQLFGRKAGIEVLLNTSLNAAGEPMVENLEDLKNLFQRVPIDVLIIGDTLVRRRGPTRRLMERPGGLP